MTYYLFERDLTSEHVSYHYCFLDYQKVSFHPKSKIQKDYDHIYNILANELDNVHGMRTFHKAITPQNKFIETPYFHLSVNGIDEQEYQLINSAFGLNTKHRYSYFTKSMIDIGKRTDFKCGFLLGEFNNIEHEMKQDAIDLAKTLGGGTYNVLYAFDFDENGKVIDDNINVELLPNYSTETFLNTKKILTECFPHINKTLFDKYEHMFDGYYPTKFHFHFKVKLYKGQKPTVKFYRTYNSKNPYIQ